MPGLISRLKTILTLTCEQSSRLMSDSLDRDLRWDEKLALRGHLVACRVCPIIKKQIEAISRAAREISASDNHDAAACDGADAEAKKRWKNAIRAHSSSE